MRSAGKLRLCRPLVTTKCVIALRLIDAGLGERGPLFCQRNDRSGGMQASESRTIVGSLGRCLKTCLGLVLADEFGPPAFCQRFMCFYYICLCETIVRYVVHALQGAMPTSRVRKSECFENDRSHFVTFPGLPSSAFGSIDASVVRRVFQTPL
jgi:hypothetical protein